MPLSAVTRIVIAGRNTVSPLPSDRTRSSCIHMRQRSSRRVINVASARTSRSASSAATSAPIVVSTSMSAPCLPIDTRLSSARNRISEPARRSCAACSSAAQGRSRTMLARSRSSLRTDRLREPPPSLCPPQVRSGKPRASRKLVCRDSTGWLCSNQRANNRGECTAPPLRHFGARQDRRGLDHGPHFSMNTEKSTRGSRLDAAMLLLAKRSQFRARSHPLVGGHATVDHQLAAGDPGGIVGGEVEAARRDVVRRPEAAERRRFEALACDVGI